jgi:hypothetical protein
LRPATGGKFDIKNARPDRNGPEQKTIPNFNRGAIGGDETATDRPALRSKYIPPLAVGIAKERNPGRAIRVVFEGLNRSRDIALVIEEVDHAVDPLGSSAAVARGYAAGGVSADCPMKAGTESPRSAVGKSFAIDELKRSAAG